MQTADVVIIGAGVNGAATAYNLLKRGLKRVVLLDKHCIASGGTGRSAAIIRQHYSNEELVRIVKRSVDIFHHFSDVVGGDPGFVNTGWAFLIPDHVSGQFAENLALAQQAGVDVREISEGQLLAMEPRLELSDVSRIAYEPESGYADPIATTHAYAHRFLELGGQLMAMNPARGLLLSGGKVSGVRTEQGDISTDVVVNAAGPWAGRVAAWANLDVPIRVTREEEIVLETAPAGGPPRLAFSDMAQAIYYRPHGATGMLVGRGFPKEYEDVEPNEYCQEVRISFIADATKRLGMRWPGFRNTLVVNAYTGLYDVTPDWHPILGETETVRGFYMCAGFSGHGFKIAPAIGELMAEDILTGKRKTSRLSRFNLNRFEKGEPFTAAYGGNRA